MAEARTDETCGHGSSIADVPLECLVKVVQRLGTVDWATASLVSRAFRAACDSALWTWHFLDLKNCGAFLDDARFTSLAARLGPSLKRLELDTWHLSDTALLLLPQTLEKLAVCGADHHSDALLAAVADRLGHRLRYFALSAFSGGAITAAGFGALAAQCMNLTTFAVDSGKVLDVNAAVHLVAASCPFLSELSAYDLLQETLLRVGELRGSTITRLRHKRRRAGAIAPGDSCLLAICHLFPHLEELHLIDKVERSTDVLSDTGVMALGTLVPTLQSLRLRAGDPAYTEQCSEVALMQLGSMCRRLAQWELSNFKRLTDAPALEFIQNSRAHLVEVHLDYSPITDATLDLLAQHCSPHLRTLSIKGCRKLTIWGVSALGQCCALESLNAGQASGVTDSSVTNVCRGTPTLRAMVVNYAQLSDTSVKALAANCPLLEELALHHSGWITGGAVRALAQGCPALRYLSLGYCEKVTDGAILELARSCRGLQKLRLDGCRQLSNPCVKALAKYTLKLRYLSMQHCGKLSDEVFKHLLAAPGLRFVDLGRGKLSSEAIDSYALQRPHVDLHIDGQKVLPLCAYVTPVEDPG